MINKNSKRGSVALMSVLIISAILIVLVTTMSDANISVSQQYANNYSDNSSYYIAEACLEETMLRLEDNTAFAGTTLEFENATCTTTVTGVAPKTIGVEVEYLDYVQNYQAEVTITVNGQANNLHLSSLEEVQ